MDFITTFMNVLSGDFEVHAVPERSRKKGYTPRPKRDRVAERVDYTLAVIKRHPKGITRDQIRALTPYGVTSIGRYVRTLLEQKRVHVIDRRGPIETLAACNGTPCMVHSSSEAILNLVRKHPEGIRCDEISKTLGMPRSTVDRRIRQMLDHIEVRGCDAPRRQDVCRELYAVIKEHPGITTTETKKLVSAKNVFFYTCLYLLVDGGLVTLCKPKLAREASTLNAIEGDIDAFCKSLRTNTHKKVYPK